MPSPSSTRPQWTRAGTLLLAIDAHALPLRRAGLELDGIALQRQRALHATIVGTALGARVRDAIATDASVGVHVQTAIALQEWQWGRGLKWTLIGKSDAEHTRHSLVEWIELPAMASFHRQLGAILGQSLPVPPPHVTLYTSSGRGIGLPDPATLARLRRRDVDATELAGVL